MKTLLALSLATLSFAASAQAAEVACHFTEPFITMIVNEEAGTVKEIFPEGEALHSILELSRENGETRVVFGPGIEENTVLTYVRDGKGSDGMSDRIYPYSAQNWTGDTLPQHGGCSTQADPVIDPVLE